MRALIYLGHPAHFHLFKNTIHSLKASGNKVLIVIKKKDVLENLLRSAKLEYENILPERRGRGIVSIGCSLLKQDLRTYSLVRRFKPDIMLGTSSSIAHVGRFTGIPSIVLQEDDWDVISPFAWAVYPFAHRIMAPACCRMGRWERKTMRYSSYHELAYLHPEHFKPDPEVVKGFHRSDRPYFILRFVNLDAFHDNEVKGINMEMTIQLIEMLKPHGEIYITSERELAEDLEPYRIAIDPLDIHHALYYAKMFIGDSQTMAAEAAVLGTPSLRCNDFVGRIGYLEELENHYKLGYGFKPNAFPRLLETLGKLLADDGLEARWAEKRDKMLSEKINLADLLSWFVESYPSSERILQETPHHVQAFARPVVSS